MGANHPFKGLITLLKLELTFVKIKDSTNIWLTYGYNIILFTAEVSLQKLGKASYGSFLIFLNTSVLFPDSSTLSQAFTVAK